MSFGLARGKELDPAPVGLTPSDLGPLPDEILTDPKAGWIDPRSWFLNPGAPFELEIGSGKGTFLVHQAAASPETNYLGIEWAHEFWLYAADRLRRRGLANVKLLNADATQFLQWRLPDAIVNVLHLYFSDPWPKTKHHKRRVVQDSFLTQVHRVLTPGGELRIVTDHDDYWSWMEEHFDRWCSGRGPIPGVGFERHAYSPPEWVGDGELVGTNYERKFKRDDRPAHSVVLRKPAV